MDALIDEEINSKNEKENSVFSLLLLAYEFISVLFFLFVLISILFSGKKIEINETIIFFVPTVASILGAVMAPALTRKKLEKNLQSMVIGILLTVSNIVCGYFLFHLFEPKFIQPPWEYVIESRLNERYQEFVRARSILDHPELYLVENITGDSVRLENIKEGLIAAELERLNHELDEIQPASKDKLKKEILQNHRSRLSRGIGNDILENIFKSILSDRINGVIGTGSENMVDRIMSDFNIAKGANTLCYYFNSPENEGSFRQYLINISYGFIGDVDSVRVFKYHQNRLREVAEIEMKIYPKKTLLDEL